MATLTDKKRNARLEQYLQERNIPTTSLEANSIREGIAWADENPKESKQDIINNAKEFLRINFERGDDGYSCYYPDRFERLLWQFDLWMR
jgi:hypothetical protein